MKTGRAKGATNQPSAEVKHGSFRDLENMEKELKPIRYEDVRFFVSRQ